MRRTSERRSRKHEKMKRREKEKSCEIENMTIAEIIRAIQEEKN